MYLYMCSFLETKSVALSRGRPPQNKRKGMPLESAPLDIKLHSLALPIWLWIGIREGRQNSTLTRTPLAPEVRDSVSRRSRDSVRNMSTNATRNTSSSMNSTNSSSRPCPHGV